MNDEYLGFTVYKYNTNGNNINSASDATPATTISYDDIDKNNGAYVYYTRNIWTLKFHSNNEDVKTEDVYYQADLSEYGTFVPTNGPVGHRFAGWYADPAFGTEFDFDTTMINASVTVYAKWEKLQYHVHLNTNGGELYGTQIGDFDVDFEETLDRTSLENSVRRENWVLVGWFDEATGKAYAYGKVTSDVNLIAKWRFPGLVKVVYDAGENGTNPPSDNGNYSGASAVVVGRPSDANPGYMFVGWKIQGVENSANYLPNDIFEIPDEAIVIDPNDPDRGTVTLVADYLLIDMTVFGKTSITFYPNGGSGTEETISNLHINESTQALAASVAGTREGYRFVGWSKKAGLENYTDADIFCQPGQTIFADNDGVDNKLYAAWRKILTIEIVGNHASNPYDGTKHEVDGYEVIYKIGNEIVSAPTGVTIALASGASAHAERTDVGTTNMGLNENSFVITSTDYAFNPETDLTVMDGYQEISRVTVTITAKSNEWIYSGSPHTEPGFTVEGLPENDTHTFTVVMTADSTITHVGTQPNVIATVDGVAVVPGTQVQVGNYLVTVVSGTLTITAKAVVVKADDAGKVYDNDPTNPSEYTATVTGLVGSDTITYTVTREAGEDVGTYPITPTGEATQGNYTVTYVPGTFEIKPVKLEIHVKGAEETVTYNGEDQKLGVNLVFEVVNKEDVPAGLEVVQKQKVKQNAHGTNVGTYEQDTLTAEVLGLSGEGAGNYSVTFVVDSVGYLKIDPKAVTVTADYKSKVYDNDPSTDPELTATVEGLIGDDKITYTLSREDGQDVGEYTITPTGEATQGNYTVTYVPGTFEITAKAVVVKADDKSKTYGDTDPELTATVTGLVGSDTITYTVTREAGEDVGTYTITPAGDATQGNYTVTYETGTFTITAAELSITINDASKVYGDADPELTYTAEGLVNGETIPEDLITIWRDAGEDVGTYPIHGKIGPKTSIRRMVYKPVKAGSTFDVNNYNITINEGTFEITPAEVTVTADSFTKKQGEADPTLTAKVTGLVNGDDESVISYSLNREAGEKPGIYAITPTGEAVQGNYKVTFVSGKLTIKEKDKEIEFGEFSLMWVSDTLLKGEGAYDDAFKAIVDYAEKNAKAFGTIAMIGTGNMVDAFDNEAAWNSAKNSLKDLTKVQFFSVAGTKDVNGDEMSYDAYLAAKLSGRATSYKDGSVWYRSFGSKNLMLVGIGYQKIAETDEEKDRQNKWLAFVNETIAIHRSEKVILILNDYMDETGELTPFGKLIEEKIVKGNKNVCMVLCGNANGAVHKEMAYGERKVAVAMFNYAADEENGLGLVRVITINPMTKTVEIQTIDAIEGEARAYDPLKPEEDSFRFEDLF
ncbi:MAG: MBG domain-containing protein [Clostridia bacterium]|nr:MBG domain-containing protein [Clostridia bacterium]